MTSRGHWALALVVAVAGVVVAAGEARAQASVFTIRGLGMPGRLLSTRAIGTGGAFGLFDPESGLNAGAFGYVPTMTVTFTTLQEYRSVDLETGSASLRGTRFPLASVLIPFKNAPVVIGMSAAGYANRDFSVVQSDTVDLRGQPVAISDTIMSEGGITDLRFSAALRNVGPATIGASFHVLTGRDRISVRRGFEDSTYLDVVQRAELSTTGVGFSLGTVITVAPRLWVSALVRSDGTQDLERDSIDVSADLPLPWTFGGGLRWRPTEKLDVAVQGLYRTWSDADSVLVSLGPAGAANTVDLSAGVELVKSTRVPSHLPLRLGVHYATLPFLVDRDHQPGEFGAAIGTGLRFAQQRAGIDVSLERIWRWGGGRRENVWSIWVGGSVRP